MPINDIHSAQAMAMRLVFTNTGVDSSDPASCDKNSFNNNEYAME